LYPIINLRIKEKRKLRIKIKFDIEKITKEMQMLKFLLIKLVGNMARIFSKI